MMLDLLTNTELNLGLLLASDLDMLLLFIHVTGMKVISLNLGGYVCPLTIHLENNFHYNWKSYMHIFCMELPRHGYWEMAT